MLDNFSLEIVIWLRRAKTIMNYQATINNYLVVSLCLIINYLCGQAHSYACIFRKYLWFCGAVSALRASARQPRRLPEWPTYFIFKHPASVGGGTVDTFPELAEGMWTLFQNRWIPHQSLETFSTPKNQC